MAPRPPWNGQRPQKRVAPSSLTPRRPLDLGRRPGTLGRPGEIWASWSRRRQVRFIRTVIVLLVLALIVWQCASDDEGTEVSTDPTVTTTATTEVAPVAAMATAVDLDKKLPARARYLSGGAANKGKVVLVGGLDSKKSSTDQIWAYDPTDGEAAQIGRLPSARHTPATAALGSKTLVMGGGQGTSIFDDVISISRSGKVTAVGKLPKPRTNAVAVSNPDGKSVFLVGGYSGTSPALEVLQTSDGVTFAPVATLLHPVRFPAVAMLGRSIWVIGGEYDKTLTAGVQRIDLDTGQVTDVAPLPMPLSRASAFTIRGAVFVAGGRTVEGRSNQILRVDPVTGSMASAGALPAERSDSTVVVLDDRAYLLGGLTPLATDTVVRVVAE